jgi:acetyl esterase/lipase
MVRFLVAILFTSAAFAGEPKVIPIWPGAAPGSENWTQKETETIGTKDTHKRIANVTRPTLLVFLPEASAANGTGVVVCPGGGFRFLAIDYEGTDVARWLNSLGVAAFVLKYRVRQTGDPNEKAETAQRTEQAKVFGAADTAQAMRVVRAHAAEWGVAPDRIGIMGFSAGGYMSAALALKHDKDTRPAFAAPIYLAAPDDLTPPADAPPLFLLQAADDKMVDNSIRMYTAWKSANIPVELHIYARGGHGFAGRKQNLPVDTWADRLRDWLAAQGLLKK